MQEHKNISLPKVKFSTRRNSTSKHLDNFRKFNSNITIKNQEKFLSPLYVRNNINTISVNNSRNMN